MSSLNISKIPHLSKIISTLTLLLTLVSASDSIVTLAKIRTMDFSIS